MIALFLLFRVEEHLLKKRPAERTIEVVVGFHHAQLDRLEAVIAAASLQVLSLVATRHDDTVAAVFQARGAGEHYASVLTALMAEPGVHKVSLL
jgi:hypothetical protein